MKQKVLSLCLFAVIGVIPFARGQSIGPDVVNSTGGSGTIDGNTYEWSIGEVMVSTFGNPVVIVTQGVLQPQKATSNVAIVKNSPDIDVFPNPSTSQINIRYNATSSCTLSYKLIDLTGKVLISESTELAEGKTTQQVDLTRFAAATYMLDVSLESNNSTVKSSTFKIQKLN